MRFGTGLKGVDGRHWGYINKSGGPIADAGSDVEYNRGNADPGIKEADRSRRLLRNGRRTPALALPDTSSRLKYTQNTQGEETHCPGDDCAECL